MNIRGAICSFDTDSDAAASHSFEEVDICKLLHLINVTFGPDDLLVVEENPCCLVVERAGQGFADERHIMSGRKARNQRDYAKL